jgi:hypothetical protein
VGVLAGPHRWRNVGELCLDLPRRDLGLRQSRPHELFVATRRFGIRLAAGVHERTAQFVEDQWAPVQADLSLVVEMDQQTAGGRAE